MDDLLISRLKYWYGDGLPVDGWVEVDPSGHLHIELFPKTIREKYLKHGDYVRIYVVREEEILEQTIPTK